MSTTEFRRRAPLFVAQRGETALELRHRPVHGRQVLGGAGRKRAVELGERAGRRELLGALDQRPLELASQMALETVDSLAVDRRAVGVLLAGRLRLEPERAADALDVDADHARALAPAAERGDREPGEIAHLALAALGDRLADRVAELVRVEPLAAPS